jgi:hypothetical protein
MASRDSVERAMRVLMKAGPSLPESIASLLLAHRDAVVPRLIEIVDHAEEYEEGNGAWAPVHAVRLLCEMRAVEAVPSLVPLLGAYDAFDEMYSTLSIGLQQMGSAVVEPCLVELASASNEDHRHVLLEVLAGCGTRDERIRSALLSLMREVPDFGAGLIGEYGDETLVPELEALFDSLPIRPAHTREDHHLFIEVADAIEQLAGALDERRAQRFRVARLLYRQNFLLEINEREEENRRVRRTEALLGDLRGSEPCWCGSEKRYSHCHRDEDRARPT